MRSPAFHAIVACKDIYNYYVEKGDLKLYVDPLYKKGVHKVTSGIVHSPPASMPSEEKVGIPIRKGDKVYFHYNSLDEDSLIPQTQGLFLIPMDMIFGYVRDGVLTPMDGKAFCTPYVDPDIIEIEHGKGKMKVRRSPSGIITEINLGHDVKRATVSHIGAPWKGHPTLEVSAGDRIIYATDADFENTIEGETFFVMDQDLILAVE